MNKPFTILHWPILPAPGEPEEQPEPLKGEPVVAPRLAIPIEQAAQDPRFAMLFPRQKRPAPQERS